MAVKKDGDSMDMQAMTERLNQLHQSLKQLEEVLQRKLQADTLLLQRLQQLWTMLARLNKGQNTDVAGNFHAIARSPSSRMN